MDFDLFERAIKECAENGLYSIRLSWRGECTLHPMIFEMIELAKRRGIAEVSFLTNGSMLEHTFCRKLISSGLDYLTISVDGLEEHYNQTRKPLLFRETVKRIAHFYRLKEDHGQGFPKIKIQGIYSCFKQDPELYYRTFQPISDLVSFNLEHDYSIERQEAEGKVCCPYLWQRLTVTSSGVIPLCIADWDIDHRLADLNHTTISAVWHGNKMNAIRALHKTGSQENLTPCMKCIRLQEAHLNQ